MRIKIWCVICKFVLFHRFPHTLVNPRGLSNDWLHIIVACSNQTPLLQTEPKRPVTQSERFGDADMRRAHMSLALNSPLCMSLTARWTVSQMGYLEQTCPENQALAVIFLVFFICKVTNVLQGSLCVFLPMYKWDRF